MLDNFLFIFIFRILCCDFQNITFYSEYRCKILFLFGVGGGDDVIIDV